MSFFRVTEQRYFQLPLELSLKGVKLGYEIRRQKIPRTVELLILPSSPLSPSAQRLCEMLSKIFLAPLIDGSQAAETTSTIMKIEETNNITHLTFFHGALGKEVGPELRIGTVKFLERASM